MKHGELEFVQSTHENQYAQGWIQILLGSEVNLKSGVHMVCACYDACSYFANW
jgi:hypothetical protein